METKTLASTNSISQQNCEDYAESYSTLGHILMDLPILHQLHSYIASLLPDDYNAVSLGSGHGK